MTTLLDEIIAAAVRETDDGHHDFACPGFVDDACGENGVPFTSTGWPSHETAVARGREHIDDHKGIAPMSELHEFRVKHGVEVRPDGVAVLSIKDI